MERLIGRALAFGLHPVLAWRALRPTGRFALAAGYAGAGYVGVLILLLSRH
ncbi:MAG: hypothetical protein ACM3SQ_01695 [Betaproteobacteria bacterium]